MLVFFVALSVVLCLGCLTATIYAARHAARVAGLPAAKLRSLASEIESLKLSVEEWSTITTNLANSAKMQRVRAAAKQSSSDRSADGLPDPHTDPEGWRKAMNLRIAERRLNGTHK